MNVFMTALAAGVLLFASLMALLLRRRKPLPGTRAVVASMARIGLGVTVVVILVLSGAAVFGLLWLDDQIGGCINC